MNHIDSINATYCIRAKSNLSIEINDIDDSDLIGCISHIEPLFSKSKLFNNVKITKNKFKTNLAVSKTDTHNEPLFILTNGNTREAIKHYGFRFRFY